MGLIRKEPSTLNATFSHLQLQPPMPRASILEILSTRLTWIEDAPPRIFCIEEILLHVLSFLSPSDVLHFSLTNRTVLDAGLDIIWQRTTTLTPLLELLPEGIVHWKTRKHDWAHMVRVSTFISAQLRLTKRLSPFRRSPEPLDQSIGDDLIYTHHAFDACI